MQKLQLILLVTLISSDTFAAPGPKPPMRLDCPATTEWEISSPDLKGKDGQFNFVKPTQKEKATFTEASMRYDAPKKKLHVFCYYTGDQFAVKYTFESAYVPFNCKLKDPTPPETSPDGSYTTKSKSRTVTCGNGDS